MNAVVELYETLPFKSITMKEISARTSFSRPSIYNYFQTREEIFLAIYGQQFEELALELDKETGQGAEHLANVLASSISSRPLLIKLFSCNLYDLEGSSRMENLVSFKRQYGNFMQAVKEAVTRFVPSADVETFLYVFLPLMYGLYPFAFISHKQKAAMKEAGYTPCPYDVYELIRRGVLALLNGKEIYENQKTE